MAKSPSHLLKDDLIIMKTDMQKVEDNNLNLKTSTNVLLSNKLND